MHEKKSQFIHLKIPPHLARLLGKIHALSIEVLGHSTYFMWNGTLSVLRQTYHGAIISKVKLFLSVMQRDTGLVTQQDLIAITGL